MTDTWRYENDLLLYFVFITKLVVAIHENKGCPVIYKWFPSVKRCDGNEILKAGVMTVDLNESSWSKGQKSLQKDDFITLT